MPSIRRSAASRFRAQGRSWLTAWVALWALGCGGTWNDDPQNFERIFRVEQPADVQVIRSHFWRSAHWSYEYRYFIALKPNESFLSQLTGPAQMTPTSPSKHLLEACWPEPPAWFLPKPISDYDAWIPVAAEAQYRVFRDRDNGTVFVCDMQL